MLILTPERVEKAAREVAERRVLVKQESVAREAAEFAKRTEAAARATAEAAERARIELARSRNAQRAAAIVVAAAGVGYAAWKFQPELQKLWATHAVPGLARAKAGVLAATGRAPNALPPEAVEAPHGEGDI